ncbi:hypothetical protein Q4E93_05980 [Flavitalea sp. BT771]|uniref:hypothetical protein n=1 Tax=Flavitalea sp. BT771 TaxID=3063329 RepID=UPI0026E2D8A8|nr:hypothetical protein [Flavitalea sp. BT771]MDO6430123.1 hypothetical protein [Flavitalea sp. BT771]MDV6219738.1 hypothetical protein [Flavitalea sp. BT771]
MKKKLPLIGDGKYSGGTVRAAESAEEKQTSGAVSFHFAIPDSYVPSVAVNSAPLDFYSSINRKCYWAVVPECPNPNLRLLQAIAGRMPVDGARGDLTNEASLKGLRLGLAIQGCEVDPAVESALPFLR